MNLLKVKTLFLDDDDDLKNTLEVIFEHRNFVEYEWYKYSEELFKNLTDNTQVIVIDYVLEEHNVNGIDIIKKVKQINAICHCILMSNQISKKVIIDAYDNGCDKYIDKGDPNYVNQLFAEIQKGIDKVNREFQDFVGILTRMKETNKIIEEAQHEIIAR